jgi:hypothetical protein
MSREPHPGSDPLSAIREREAKATPGPWVATAGYDGGATVAVMRDWRGGNVAASVLGPDAWIHGAPRSAPDDNAEFIAHAREDIPALLALYEAALARIAALEATQEQPTKGQDA